MRTDVIILLQTVLLDETLIETDWWLLAGLQISVCLGFFLSSVIHTTRGEAKVCVCCYTDMQQKKDYWHNPEIIPFAI